MARNRTFHTIIVSDGDPLFVALLTQQLLGRGMMVMADLESEILDLARRVEASLVILGGWQRNDSPDLLRQLQTDPPTKAIPVVVASSKTDDFTHDLCMQLGAVDYCLKPLDSQFIEKVLRHVAFSKSRP